MTNKIEKKVNGSFEQVLLADLVRKEVKVQLSKFCYYNINNGQENITKNRIFTYIFDSNALNDSEKKELYELLRNTGSKKFKDEIPEEFTSFNITNDDHKKAMLNRLQVIANYLSKTNSNNWADREKTLKVILKAFKIEHRSNVNCPAVAEDIATETEKVENIVSSDLAFIGYYYSSFKYKLKQCSLVISGHSAVLTYLGDNKKKSYEGVITDGCSIDLRRNADGKTRHIHMLLSGNVNMFDTISALWIKHHQPFEQNITYETMGYILFEKVDESQLSKGQNYPVGKLAKIAGSRFDKVPICIDKTNIRNKDLDFFHYKLRNIVGVYELYQILLDRSVVDYKYFSLLKLEITDNLEIILHETKNRTNENGENIRKTREGYFIEHPANDDAIILHFPPCLVDPKSMDFMTIMFTTKDNQGILKGVIAETCSGYPYCGAIYLRRNSKLFLPNRMGIEEVFSSVYDNKKDYPDFMDYFIGQNFEYTIRNNHIAPYIQLSELYKYKKLIDEPFVNIKIDKLKYVFFDLTGTIADMLKLDRTVLDYLCQKYLNKRYEEVNISRDHELSLEQNIKQVFFKNIDENVYESYEDIIMLRINNEVVKLEDDKYHDLEVDINGFTLKAFDSVKETFKILKKIGINVAIVSNRRDTMLKTILEKLKISDIPAYSAPDHLGGDKPEANILSELIQLYEKETEEVIDPDEILFIGDTQEDYKCAEKIDCNFMFYMGKLSSSQLGFLFEKYNSNNQINKIRNYSELNKYIKDNYDKK